VNPKETVKAFAPGNISCFFKIYLNENPEKMGSLGMGFTINEGVIAEVSRTEQTTIKFNGDIIDFPTVANVIDLLTKESLTVTIATKLPLGSGFGLSGASSLATAYAINKLLKLNKSNKELAVVAHRAEVKNKTGLGDVTNQYFGGMLVKYKPSSEFMVEKLPLVNCKVYCKYISKLSTASILTNPTLVETINHAADEALEKIKKQTNPSLGEIIQISKTFAVESGLLQDNQVKRIIETVETNNGNASMIMLGNAVMSDIPFEGATEYVISDVSAHLV